MEFNLIKSGDGFVSEFYNQLPNFPDLTRKALYEHLNDIYRSHTGKDRYSSYEAFSGVYSKYLKQTKQSCT